MRSFLLGLFLLVSVPAAAQTSDPSEGSNGAFGAKLMIIDDPKAFWDAWNQPENPTINTTSRITQSRPVYGMIILHDCKAGSDGKCKVTARFDMTGPDGKPYDEPHSATAWNQAPAENHLLQASPASIGFRLEPQDKLGRYEIRVTLTDEIARKSVTLRQFVTAEDDAERGDPSTIS
jgi:hypothetical protein